MWWHRKQPALPSLPGYGLPHFLGQNACLVDTSTAGRAQKFARFAPVSNAFHLTPRNTFSTIFKGSSLWSGGYAGSFRASAIATMARSNLGCAFRRLALFSFASVILKTLLKNSRAMTSGCAWQRARAMARCWVRNFAKAGGFFLTS